MMLPELVWLISSLPGVVWLSRGIVYSASNEQVFGRVLLSGMNPMTNSRNCTCQQSSVNRRDQCVCTKVSVQNMLAGSQGFCMHIGNIELQCGWLRWLAAIVGCQL